MKSHPTSWASTTIREVLLPSAAGKLIVQGWSPQCHRTPAADSESWGVLKTTAIQTDGFLPEENKSLPDHLEPRPELEVQQGDLLITCAGPRSRCGVACLVRTTRPRLMISGKMYRLRANESVIDPRCAAYYLQSPGAQRAIDAVKTGISDSGLNLTHERFLSLPLPLPPLPEQRRIVEAIEAAFSKLDAGVAYLEAARKRTSRLTMALLHKEIDQQAAAPLTIAELAVLVTDGDHRPPPRVADGIPHLSSKHIRDGALILHDCSYLSDAGFEQTRARYEPMAGDVIVTCVGSIGRTAVVPAGLVFSADRNLAGIRPRPAVDSRYLSLALSAPNAQRQMLSASGATAQPHIYLRDLRRVEVPLPGLDEQRAIAQRLDMTHEHLARLTRDLQREQTRSDGLRRAVLAAAFSGRLVSQNAADEPGEVLLARAQRESDGTTPRAGQRRARTRGAVS